ncbi:hypothetical protein AC578_4929 [Pseudocercospora eumusae]|uniref:Uncharacterized protein n=1 Tax=Pseudocercospora eumusae TaxID=321146 RepID=A0A139HNJ3_9PEZI|nr:hypothetical protein AC578_4929 [Pseudocercospora eumusae]
MTRSRSRHRMQMKRVLAAEAEGPPFKRHSTSPAHSPLSPRSMPAPLQDSLDILQHYTSFDMPDDPTSHTSAMDVDAPSVPGDAYLPSSPTPRAAMDAHTEDTPPARHREDSVQNFDFAALSPLTREKHYRTAFENLVIPLKDLKPPPPCRQYPSIAEEIFKGYHHHATFVVRVWINYDAVTQKFFLDPDRLAGCGKLRLGSEKRRYLESLGDGLEFSSLRFEIGSPFRVLARMNVDMIYQETEDLDGESTGGLIERVDVGASLVDPVTGKTTISNDGLLRRWIMTVRNGLRSMPLEEQQGRHGWRLRDLDKVAQWLVYNPHSQDQADECCDG